MSQLKSINLRYKPFIRYFQTQLNSYRRKKQGKARKHQDLSRFKLVERIGARFVFSISYKLEVWALGLRSKVWSYLENNFIVEVWGLKINEVHWEILAQASSHSEIEKEREELADRGGLGIANCCNPPFYKSIELYLFFPFSISVSHLLFIFLCSMIWMA